MGKADAEEVGVYLGGAKYFIAPWLGVYAVNAGDKPMGHWLLAVTAWLSLAKKKKKILSAPSMRRPTGKMPGMPDYQSSPDLGPSVCISYIPSLFITECSFIVLHFHYRN